MNDRTLLKTTMKQAILFGMGLMIDISGSSGVRVAGSSRPICSEIAEDFKRVGDDFRAAIQTEIGQPVIEVEADNQDQYLLSI